MTTEREEQVDWDAAVRRERRKEAQDLALAHVAVIALLLLLFDPADEDDRAFVLVASALVLATALGTTVWFRSGLRGGRTDRYRSRYAVLEHVDPGPGLRVPTDDLARTSAPNRWACWLPGAARPAGRPWPLGRAGGRRPDGDGGTAVPRPSHGPAVPPGQGREALARRSTRATARLMWCGPELSYPRSSLQVCQREAGSRSG